jgi:DNA adenine methylase
MHPNNDGAFVFLDPPYKIGSYLYGTNAEMHKSFDHDDFIAQCKKCPNRWMVTYNNDIDLKEGYKGYNQEEFRITYGMKHRADNRHKSELLVTNYTEVTPLEALF